MTFLVYRLLNDRSIIGSQILQSRICSIIQTASVCSALTIFQDFRTTNANARNTAYMPNRKQYAPQTRRPLAGGNAPVGSDEVRSTAPSTSSLSPSFCVWYAAEVSVSLATTSSEQFVTSPIQIVSLQTSRHVLPLVKQPTTASLSVRFTQYVDGSFKSAHPVTGGKTSKRHRLFHAEQLRM